MIRVINKSTLLLKKQHILPRSSLVLFQKTRYSSSLPNSHKIYALPFKLPEEKVHQIVNIASYVNQHAFFGIFKIFKSIFTRKMPEVKESVSSMQVRKAYLPLWYYDMAVSADITPSSKDESESAETILKTMGPARQMLGIGFDCYWPGHVWDPVCYLSLARSPLTRIEDMVPFSPELYESKDDIEIIPFTVNPLVDIVERTPNALEHLTVDSPTHKSGILTMHQAKVLFSSVYPIYWPVYIAQFTVDQKEEDKPKTVVIAAHSDDPPIYQWDSSKKGAEQWINNGPWVNLDVTEPEWQMGFGAQPPLRYLVHRFLTEVVGQFQTTTIDWDDDRIQAYPNYQHQNREYLKQLFKVWAERNMLLRIEGLDENQRTVGLRRGSTAESKDKAKPLIQVQTVGDIRSGIESRVSQELARLEELEPVWYKEYIKKKKNEQ